MRKKERRPVWPWLAFLAVAGVGILTGYFVGYHLGTEEIRAKTEQAPGDETMAGLAGQAVDAPEGEAASNDTLGASEGIGEEALPYGTSSPGEIEAEVTEFFTFLDTQDFVQRLDTGTRSYEHFERMIRKLSSNPPIPAGEGMDLKYMYRNIFHFFRLLNRNDLYLIRETISHDTDSMEMNLDLFYRWLTVEEPSQESEGLRPSLDVRYQYAGFFLNTIGGRAYLFRRSLGLRLLISYYCILIIHEADKEGRNTYGIDVLPTILAVKNEIGNHPGFRYRDEYIRRLNTLESYYLAKR
jgi:hypothetical protein